MVGKASERFLKFFEPGRGWLPGSLGKDRTTDLQCIPEPLASNAEFMQLVSLPETAICGTKETLHDRPQPAACKRTKALGIISALTYHETVRGLRPLTELDEIGRKLSQRASTPLPSSGQHLCQLSTVCG